MSSTADEEAALLAAFRRARRGATETAAPAEKPATTPEPVETSSSASKPLVAEPVAAAPAPIATALNPHVVDDAEERATCTVCLEPVADTDDHLVRGACAHRMHLACALPLLLGGRAHCTACPLARSNEEARAAGGYSVDTGNDADVRASIAEALTYRREQVRLTHIEDVERRTGSHRALVDDESRVLYTEPGTEPGGAGTAEGVAACTRADCGGPRLCLHRHLAPVTVSRAAAAHYRFYDAPRPFRAANVHAARAAMHTLLVERAPPSAWARCGASVEVLAALDIDLDELVRGGAMLLEDVLEGLEVRDADRLVLLGFEPSLLRHHNHYPVVVLARAGVSARTLMRASGPLSYDALASEYGLSHEELAFLGFDARTLAQLGMFGTDVVRALRHEHVRAHTRDDAAWWLRALRVSPPLLAALFPRTLVDLFSAEDKLTYARLDVALAHA